MRTRLSALLLGLWMLAGLPASLPAQTTVTALYGAQMACDPALAGCIAIPLTVTVMCTVSCPLRVSPSYVSSTEFWASSGSGTGTCVRSTDGGATWPACTSQPFATGANELYAMAADGSIVAFGTTVGPTTCTASRSTNNATSWGVTFTQLTDCNPGNLEGQYLYCLTDGRCEVAFNNANTFKVFRSSNNGQSWTAGETGSASCGGSAGSVWNGSIGMLPSENPPCGGGNLATAFSASADAWAVSTPWTGTQGDCWGSVIYNSAARVICQTTGGVPDSRYSMRDSTGALIGSLTLPGALTTSIDAGGPAIGPFTNTLYMVATRSTDTGIYLSRDNLATFNVIGTLGAAVTVRGGHWMQANGCVYFVGGVGRVFTKICP